MSSLYYCMGGGLGHLTRLIAFCHTFAIKPAVIINCNLSSGKLATVAADRVFVPTDSDQKNKENLKKYITDVIRAYNPTQIIIDAFPGGILGELAEIPELQNLECIYLMRILQHKKYMQRVSGSLPKFQKIFILEKLLPEQDEWLQLQFQSIIEPLELYDPPRIFSKSKLPPGYWLIIHSHPVDEIEELYNFALQTALINKKQPQFVVVSPGVRPEFLPDSVMHFNEYPADRFFDKAERIFSAAGFNIIRQLKSTGAIHQVLPFPRALDDQFARAANMPAKL